MKRLLIALLGVNALLIALFTAQEAQAAWTKSENSRVSALEKRIEQLEQQIASQSAQNTAKGYDAIKLAEYSGCLNSFASSNTYQEWKNKTVISFCSIYRP